MQFIGLILWKLNNYIACGLNNLQAIFYKL